MDNKVLMAVPKPRHFQQLLVKIVDSEFMPRVWSACEQRLLSLMAEGALQLPHTVQDEAISTAQGRLLAGRGPQGTPPEGAQLPVFNTAVQLVEMSSRLTLFATWMPQHTEKLMELSQVRLLTWRHEGTLQMCWCVPPPPSPRPLLSTPSPPPPNPFLSRTPPLPPSLCECAWPREGRI